MELQLIYHHNLIGHEIDESLKYYADDVLDREVYCRKLHKVTEPMKTECMNCIFFAGLEQGHGIECAWEDVADTDGVIYHKDRYREYERVDKLMKQGVLKQPKRIDALWVKNLKYDNLKWIYEHSDYNTYRYILGTRGNKSLICIGVNPSTASPDDLDNTMKSVERKAYQFGYDSYIMINLYPQRAANSDDLDNEMDAIEVEKNLDYIKSILSKGSVDIWCAWGNLINKRAYLKDSLFKIADIAKSYDCHWFSVGEHTKDGHPHHPLYLSRDSKLECFDIQSYIKSL